MAPFPSSLSSLPFTIAFPPTNEICVELEMDEFGTEGTANPGAELAAPFCQLHRRNGLPRCTVTDCGVEMMKPSAEEVLLLFGR